MASEMEIYAPKAPAAVQAYEMSVQEMVGQVTKIQEVMSAVMKADTHYGVIPGTPKPTLFKPGAEKLCMLFRLDPQYDSMETWDGPHLTVKTRCTLFHIPTGERRGSGEGSCSTKETKYAYRKGERKCPKCGKEAIIKGQDKYGGGWLCWKKKDGCGEKFKDGDKSIESQEAGRVANPDLPDCYNTVLKMSNKRALVAAVLNVTAASDIFTQDIEDLPEFERAPAAKPVEQERKAKTPEDHKEEVLSRISALLRKHKLMAQAAREERGAALWHAFEVRELEAVPNLHLQALRDGYSVLEAMLTQRTQPGDESIPFDDEREARHAEK